MRVFLVTGYYLVGTYVLRHEVGLSFQWISRPCFLQLARGRHLTTVGWLGGFVRHVQQLERCGL